MLKSASQMRFEQESDNLEKQLGIFSQRILRLTSYEKINIYLDTYSQLHTKVKSLNSLYAKIDSEMKMKKNHNQYDLKEKLRKYSSVRDKITSKYDSIGKDIEAIKKAYLTDKGKGRDSGKGSNDIEMRNMTKVNQLMSRYQFANDDLKETEQITSAWMPELHAQGERINEMRDDLKEAQAELGMVDQLMRIIKNRNMMTKLLLVVMILLMGIVDVMLFAIKIL